MADPLDKTINASPTKEFFIYMLTKDITLIRSIIDLVDNSADGARRVYPDSRYQGLWVRIEVGTDQFRIVDNCMGIPFDLAKNYAFRFGRPKDMPRTDHSVGQFGVGMKRSLFKLGRRFTIESRTTERAFVVKQDVEKWLEDPDRWQFKFDSIKEYVTSQPSDNSGTTISVTRLHDSVVADFESEIFLRQLKEAIQSAHQETIKAGLAISLNGVPLDAPIAKLLQSAELKPAHQLLRYSEDGETPVSVRLYAGIAESNPQDAGWNIFCNGRLVLEADGDSVTGWGEDNSRTIPRFHNQFARFRGYVFFDCDDASLLPWNTTKTGVDSDSEMYQSVRLRMIEMMRPVITFLNRLDAEKDADEGEVVLTPLVDKATHMNLESVSEMPHFVSPEALPRRRSSGPRTRKIQYSKPEREINTIKEVLHVATLKEVGEQTFEYFLEMECE